MTARHGPRSEHGQSLGRQKRPHSYTVHPKERSQRPPWLRFLLDHSNISKGLALPWARQCPGAGTPQMIRIQSAPTGGWKEGTEVGAPDPEFREEPGQPPFLFHSQCSSTCFPSPRWSRSGWKRITPRSPSAIHFICSPDDSVQRKSRAWGPAQACPHG